METLSILTTTRSKGYELLDSGEGEKLERFGDYVLARPDPQALWKKRMPEAWNDAHATFLREGKKTSWNIKPGVPERWEIELGGLSFYIRPTSFKHTGLFPEQLPNWQWIEKTITDAKAKDPARKISVLNLFGYTGGATLASAKAGAEVVHVDGSKVAIGWAKDNAEASGLSEKPIRWILDDAREFVRREIKRGNTYDGIIMDPPAFGHGPNKEAWNIEDDLLPFLDSCLEILSPQPLFFLVNGYASGYSAVAYKNALENLTIKHGGSVQIGELTIAESVKTEATATTSADLPGRLLPAGIFARWQR